MIVSALRDKRHAGRRSGARPLWEELASAFIRAKVRSEPRLGPLRSPPFGSRVSEYFRRSLVKRLCNTVQPIWGQSWRPLPDAKVKIGDRFEVSGTSVQRQAGVRLHCLLRQYPEIKRLWSAQFSYWLEALNKFLGHHSTLSVRLEKKQNRTDRVAIDFSDLHDGNRTVIEVILTSGDTWFYKPRAGQAEERWNEFLSSRYPNVFPLPFKVIRVF